MGLLSLQAEMRWYEGSEEPVEESEEKERCVIGRLWPWQVRGTARVVSAEVRRALGRG